MRLSSGVRSIGVNTLGIQEADLVAGKESAVFALAWNIIHVRGTPGAADVVRPDRMAI